MANKVVPGTDDEKETTDDTTAAGDKKNQTGKEEAEGPNNEGSFEIAE